MDGKLLNAQGGRRTFAVIMSTGDETLSAMRQFVQREKIAAKQIDIGALSDVALVDIRKPAHV